MSARPKGRGFTLVEVVVALAVMLVGMLGLMHLQVLGITSNQGARAHTQAMQLARELAAGLERLSFGDARLDPTADFGPLLDAAGVKSGHRAWDDSLLALVPGVRPDAALERDPGDTARPIFRRRWTVSTTTTSAGAPATRIVAISVIYRERTLPQPREVVLYFSTSDRRLLGANIAAYN